MENLKFINGCYVPQNEVNSIIDNATEKAYRAKNRNESIVLNDKEKPLAQKIASNMRQFGYARVDRIGNEVLISF